MDKSQRNYRLIVALSNGQGSITIQPPFTLEFDVTRNILASANTATFRVTNLGKFTRDQIYKDRYATAEYKGVELQAGYKSVMPTVFKGNMKQANSVREIGVGMVTTIEAYDGGFALVNSDISKSYAEGTLTLDAIDDVLSHLNGISRGVVGPSMTGTLNRGASFAGSPAQAASMLSNGGFFIDLERAHALGDDECIQGTLVTIDSTAGLLGTPVREETILTFDMLFEPRLLIGQQVQLNSMTESNFNGPYKVVSIRHHGTISEGVCGPCTTSVGLWYGTQLLKVVS